MNRIILLVVVIAVFSCGKKELPADLVIRGGTIYTVDPEKPTAEAIAIRKGTIVAVGTTADVQPFITEETQILELNGRTATPGFIEGHGHLMGIGYNELELDLMKAKSFDEIVSMVKDAAEKAKPGEWITGRGWHQDKWTVKPERQIKGFPVHDALSAVSPNNPVFLRHASGHAGFANAKAMEMAGVNQLSREKLRQEAAEGGEVIRDERGNPTGLFNERAQSLIADHIPENTAERDEEALRLAMRACLRNGITSFHDAGASREAIDLYHKFKTDGKLALGLYVMITGGDRDLVYEWFKKGPEIDTTGWLTVRSVKLHCDGALGSRGAWLLQPYSDRAEWYGMATLPMDTVLKTSREALKYGFQVCSHAIGDRANREVLDRYELALKEAKVPLATHRFRIEHAQHIDPADLPRFASLGVIPAMQAIHMSSDRPWAIDRLGEKRIVEGAYMWQTLLKSGARIVNGTDAPVEPVNPIPCFYASVTRKTLQGQPDGGYEPNEKMTREQALKSYTLDAAFGAFEERLKGSLQVGKRADLTIFSQDLMTIPEDKILSTTVSVVVVDGKIAYSGDQQ
ncbi:amidohydrolase [Chryseolinea sp. T2]|uniref:amidohydrolase n=1 Tax=Chryseolinea sp. T2 TaxID=3129255 RepID=UPI0030786915